MNENNNSSLEFEDIKINVKFKISALWMSTMLCYLYGDYFGLFKPGKLDSILNGQMIPIGEVTQSVLLGTSFMMAVPAIMVFLTICLKSSMSRLVNIVLGFFYTIIILVTLIGSWYYYIFLGIIEISLTSLVVWYAWTWPRQKLNMQE